MRFVSISLFIISSIMIILSFKSCTNYKEHVKLPISKQVWAIYLGWWGNPFFDNDWIHWKYQYHLSSDQYFQPPSFIPSRLHPKLGLYSSHDPSVLLQHCIMTKASGIDALILEWWGHNSTDPRGENINGFSDETLKILLPYAQKIGIKVGVMIMSYPNRSKETILEDFKYLKKEILYHQSYLKINDRPVILIYDSLDIPEAYLSIQSIKMDYNPFLVSLIRNRHDISISLEDGYDAVFPYYSSDGYTWASNSTHWSSIDHECQQRNIEFFPTVGPGFDNTKISNFDQIQYRSRKGGDHYIFMWENAIKTNRSVVIINSFNDWYNGSEIEPALSKPGYEFNEDNWISPTASGSDFLRLTKEYVLNFK